MINKPERQLTINPVVASELPKPSVHRIHDSRRTLMRAILLVLVGVTALTMPSLIPHGLNLWAAFGNFAENLKIMFVTPRTGNDTWQVLWVALAQSISLAFLTTVIGSIIAFFFALMGSHKLSPSWLVYTVQSVMAFIRAIPTILWVLIYSVALGLGANAAVIGLTFHSVAYLTKVYADSIDDLSGDSLSSLSAIGVGFWPIVTQAVIPETMPNLLSWTFIRFEINFTNAVAVGAAAGAGGIGYQLYMASGFYFDFHEVGLIVYMLLLFAVILEIISYMLRNKVIKQH